MVVDGVDEGDVEAFSVEEFSNLQHWVDVALSRERHANYVWFLSARNGRRCHFSCAKKNDRKMDMYVIDFTKL